MKTPSFFGEMALTPGRVGDMQHQQIDLSRVEERIEPGLAKGIYLLDHCIECGCCIGACGTMQMRERFVGDVGLNRVERLRLYSRDDRSDKDAFSYCLTWEVSVYQLVAFCHRVLWIEGQRKHPCISPLIRDNWLETGSHWTATIAR